MRFEPACSDRRVSVHDANAAWAQFTRDLGAALLRLDIEEFLILESTKGGYVQFAQESDRLYAEAMSLEYVMADETLATDTRLISALRTEMGELGWLLPESCPPELVPPEERGIGSPNYSLEWLEPVAFDEAARCAVATLRRVFGAGAPDDLRYVAFANEPFPPPSFPELRIPRRAD